MTPTPAARTVAAAPRYSLAQCKEDRNNQHDCDATCVGEDSKDAKVYKLTCQLAKVKVENELEEELIKLQKTGVDNDETLAERPTYFLIWEKNTLFIIITF